VPKQTLKHRSALLEELQLAGREGSAVTVAFHTALSAKVGLSAIEEKTVDILLRAGPITARELATRVALSPASVTALIGRLVAKKFVRRVPNPEDGRSILLHVRPEGVRRLEKLFRDFVVSLDDMYERYGDDELDLIVSFLREVAVRQRGATARLIATKKLTP
jgi:DNA-binding MarR family transcriptional regulator